MFIINSITWCIETPETFKYWYGWSCNVLQIRVFDLWFGFILRSWLLRINIISLLQTLILVSYFAIAFIWRIIEDVNIVFLWFHIRVFMFSQMLELWCVKRTASIWRSILCLLSAHQLFWLLIFFLKIFLFLLSNHTTNRLWF